jgi:capsule polysaccharide export protein KpsC/LpsZ
LANIKGKTDEVIQQLIKVNKITKQQANDLLGNAFQEWERKSMYQWKIDLSFLDGKNIKYHSDRS